MQKIFVYVIALCGPMIWAASARAQMNATTKSGDDAPAMVVIPAGKFLMGSRGDDDQRASDEGPQHEVSIRRFAVGKYPVTKREFAAFVKATGYRTDAERNTPVRGVADASGCYTYNSDSGTGTPFGYKAGTSWRDPGFSQGDDHPATCLSWNDAHAYVDWLRASTGKPYRLPSEAEAEYVARAGSTTRYPWGGDVEQACRYGNVGDSSLKRRFTRFENLSCDDGYVFTSPVGHFQANAFGVFDSIGNVSTWTQDCGADSYDGAPTDGSAQQSNGCERRVLRGASWFGVPGWLRSALRNRHVPAQRESKWGVRVAQDL